MANITMKRDELIAEAEGMGHTVPLKATKKEILSLLTIRPEVLDVPAPTAATDAHWCMKCRFFRKAPKGRPFMVCGKRGGQRDPNDGESCGLFEEK